MRSNSAVRYKTEGSFLTAAIRGSYAPSTRYAKVVPESTIVP